MSLKANIIPLGASSNSSSLFMLDTNAIVYAFGYSHFSTQGFIDSSNKENTRNQNSFSTFFNDLATNDNIGVYTSIQSNEIFTVCQVMVANKFKRDNAINQKVKWNQVYKENPSLVPLANNLFNQISGILDSSPVIVKINDNDYDPIIVDEIQKKILLNNPIEPNDAKIISIAIANKINNIVTAEYNMGEIDGINVITNNNSLLANRTNTDLDLFNIQTTNKIFGLSEPEDVEELIDSQHADKSE